MGISSMSGEVFFFVWVTRFFNQLGAWLKYLLYLIVNAICKFFVDFPEKMFKLVTGTGAEWTFGIDGENQTVIGAGDNDLVMAFLKSTPVQTTFFTVLGFSIVLLVIFTVIALIRAEFTTDIAKAAKGPYINRALKGIMNFILVPVLSLVFVIGVNVLTRAVNALFGGSGSLSSTINEITIYGAERATEKDENGNSFLSYLKSGEYLDSNVAVKKTAYDNARGAFEEDGGYGADSAVSVNGESTSTLGIYVDAYCYVLIDFENSGVETNVTEGIEQTHKTSIHNNNVSDNWGTATITYQIAGSLTTNGVKKIQSDIKHDINARGRDLFYVYFQAEVQDHDDCYIECYFTNQWIDSYNAYCDFKDYAGDNYEDAGNPFANVEKESELSTLIDEMFFMRTATGVSAWNAIASQGIKNWTYDDYKTAHKAGTYFIPWGFVMRTAPSVEQLSKCSSPLESPRLINTFYNPAEFNIIMGGAAAVIIGWNLMGVVFLLIKRALELAILFMISPVAVALYPLDDGAATASWRKAWQGRILAPTTIIFAYNIFFTLIKLLDIDNIGLPYWFIDSKIFGLFWTLVVVMCMSSLLKTASKLLCDIVGAEDMIGNSSAMMDKALKTATSVAGAVATGGAGVAKLAKNVVAGSKNSARS